MEGVNHKLSWDTRIRAAKHTPPFHPSWRIGREIDRVMYEITLSIQYQLEEEQRRR